MAVCNGQKQRRLPVRRARRSLRLKVEGHARGVDAEGSPKQHRETATREPRTAAAQLRFQRHEIFGKIWRLGAEEHEDGGGLRHQCRHIDWKFMATAELVDQQLLFFRCAEIAPVWHLDEKAESVRQRGVERFGAEIDVPRILIVARRRIHRRPAVAKLVQLHSLDPLLVNDGEELIL